MRSVLDQDPDLYALALARLNDITVAAGLKALTHDAPCDKTLCLLRLLRALLVERQIHMAGVPKFLRTDLDSTVDVAIREFVGGKDA